MLTSDASRSACRYDPSRGGRVVEHIEAWDVSALEVRLKVCSVLSPSTFMHQPACSWSAQAIAQIFRPGRNNPARLLANLGKKLRLLLATVLPTSIGLLGSNPLTASSALGGRSADGIVRAAEDRRTVGEIPASGIIFKDIIDVSAFRDPQVL